MGADPHLAATRFSQPTALILLAPDRHIERGFRLIKSLGKLLQVGGLVLLPVAMLMELTGMLGDRALTQMLLMLVVGAVAFVLGRLIEGYAR